MILTWNSTAMISGVWCDTKFGKIDRGIGGKSGEV